MSPKPLVILQHESDDPPGSIAAALRDLAATGTALLVAEHKTDLLDGLCDRVAVVADGRIVADGPTGAILGDDRMDAWGVEPPSRVRLARALAARGLDAALLAAAS